MRICEMADLVVLSKSHFSRAFKHSLGSSPMAYVTLRRVERAKSMMASTGERLTDIALACGFADQSHLTRCFRRVVGASPARWRRSLAIKNPGYRVLADSACPDSDAVAAEGDHQRSITTSLSGREQQISTLPAAGGSIGSGW
jgi:AraC-like DNA-binding protein